MVCLVYRVLCSIPTIAENPNQHNYSFINAVMYTCMYTYSSVQWGGLI